MKIDVANHAVSAMVKLSTEIDESTSDPIDYDMVSHFMTYSRDLSWRAMLYCLSRPADCKTQVDDMPFEEKFDHMKRSMRLTPKQGVDGHF